MVLMIPLISNNFWGNKKVFITGHTGFKGSWLSLWLRKLNAKVIGYSLAPSTKINMYELLNLKKEIISIYGNILDYENLKKNIKQYKPDIVVHMAAQSLVHESYRNPLSTYNTNVIGTANLLEAIKHYEGIKAVIVVTSDKCYEVKEQNKKYKETDAIGGYDPYSSSKACAELVANAYRKSFYNLIDSPMIATVRAGNVIGGGDFAEDRLIPDIVKSVLYKKNLKIRNPSSIRPWQYVLDLLNGYLLLAEHLVKKKKNVSGSWNFGPHESSCKTVSWISEHFLQMMEVPNKKLVSNNRKGFHETKVLKLDSLKAYKELRWKSLLKTEDVLSLTANWYKAFQQGDNMLKFTLKQIEQFEELI